MQCANCARTLPDNGRFCPYCGYTPAIVHHASALTPATSQEDAARAAATVGTRPAQTGFVLQEFGPVGALTSGSQMLVPAGIGGPSYPPPAGVPMLVPLLPGAGAAESMPYGYSTVASQPASLSSPEVPNSRKRRGRSMGWIVLYAFMAIVLLFTGLGVALHEIGSHVLGGLSAQGRTFDVFINQQFVAEGQDATLSSGRLGVLAADNNTSTQVVYSDAVIWQSS